MQKSISPITSDREQQLLTIMRQDAFRSNKRLDDDDDESKQPVGIVHSDNGKYSYKLIKGKSVDWTEERVLHLRYLHRRAKHYNLSAGEVSKRLRISIYNINKKLEELGLETL